MGGHDVTLFRLLRALNIEVSPLKADTIRRLEDGARAEPIIANPETSEDFAGDMNIDIDLLLVRSDLRLIGPGLIVALSRRRKCLTIN